MKSSGALLWSAASLLLVSPCAASDTKPPAPTSVSYFDVPVDHFSGAANKPTFKLKVLEYNKAAKPEGPIFFYSGNEGSIESFWDNTGLPFTWAEEFGAMIVFVEHRYYGSSLPFGDKTFETNANMQYLRVEQALADYAMFMSDYNKPNESGNRKPVVTMGGSYGGILSGLLRMHYSTVFDMAIAASAPMEETVNMVESTAFYAAVTEDAKNADENCPAKVQLGFTKAKEHFKTAEGRAEIQKKFNLCAPVVESEFDHFMQYARNAWTMMAMCDYPYPTNFLAPLPGQPIKAACAKALAPECPVEGLAAAVAMPYQAQDGSCNDMYKIFIECADQTGCGTGNDAKAWDYQMCADMSIIVATNNSTDMFPAREWTLDTLTEYCMEHYELQPYPEQLAVRLNIANLQKGTFENIIWSNGMLDPWHVGGYLEDLAETMPAVILKSGAHHLDLRLPNKEDPADVLEARDTEKAFIKKWISEIPAEALRVPKKGREVKPQVIDGGEEQVLIV